MESSYQTYEIILRSIDERESLKNKGKRGRENAHTDGPTRRPRYRGLQRESIRISEQRIPKGKIETSLTLSSPSCNLFESGVKRGSPYPSRYWTTRSLNFSVANSDLSDVQRKRERESLYVHELGPLNGWKTSSKGRPRTRCTNQRVPQHRWPERATLVTRWKGSRSQDRRSGTRKIVLIVYDLVILPTRLCRRSKIFALNPLTTAHFVTHRSYHTTGIVLRCAPRTANFLLRLIFLFLFFVNI